MTDHNSHLQACYERDMSDAAKAFQANDTPHAMVLLYRAWKLAINEEQVAWAKNCTVWLMEAGS